MGAGCEATSVEDNLIPSQAPYRLATPQWMIQIRAQLTASCAPPPAVFRGDQVLTPEAGQDAIPETSAIKPPFRSAPLEERLYPSWCMGGPCGLGLGAPQPEGHSQELVSEPMIGRRAVRRRDPRVRPKCPGCCAATEAIMMPLTGFVDHQPAAVSREPGATRRAAPAPRRA